jgi:hypothetical protein
MSCEPPVPAMPHQTSPCHTEARHALTLPTVVGWLLPLKPEPHNGGGGGGGGGWGLWVTAITTTTITATMADAAMSSSKRGSGPWTSSVVPRSYPEPSRTHSPRAVRQRGFTRFLRR